MAAPAKRSYRFITRKPADPPMRTCGACRTTFQDGPHWRGRPRQYCSNPCRLAALNALPRPDKMRLTGRHVTPKGYVRVMKDGRWQMEHRVVMEDRIGRPLTRAERVHHVNGDRSDNRPENLLLYASHVDHLAAEHLDGEGWTHLSAVATPWAVSPSR